MLKKIVGYLNYALTGYVDNKDYGEVSYSILEGEQLANPENSLEVKVEYKLDKETSRFIQKKVMQYYFLMMAPVAIVLSVMLKDVAMLMGLTLLVSMAAWNLASKMTMKKFLSESIVSDLIETSLAPKLVSEHGYQLSCYDYKKKNVTQMGDGFFNNTIAFTCEFYDEQVAA